MIETIVETKLPIDEKIKIQKNRIEPQHITGKEKRLCVVTGIHGDELEGQYICYELIRRLKENIGYLTGIVDVYPAVNPLGIDSITRAIPRYDLDMNRLFPGSENGALPERVALHVVQDIGGADLCIDIHSSNIFIREIPQVRLNETTDNKLLPYAKLLNVDFVWVHPSATVQEATLAHSLNSMGVPTLAVEMGVGMRITKSFGDQLVRGIFNLMHEMGMWGKEGPEVTAPIVSKEGQVSFISAEMPGIFVPCVNHWVGIKKNDCIGSIINPLTGEIVQDLLSPCDGMIFSLREYPVVYQGSLIARIWEGKI